MAFRSESALLLTGADTLRTFPPPHLPFSLVNNYGPTECTVLATSGVVPPKTETATGLPSIGRAIEHAEVFVVGSELRPLPDGDRGQICIAGAGVGVGYVGRPDLTAERFLIVPSLNGRRVYLTGDMGRKARTGEFQFCGRFDDQIKIRGYRIEPVEIVNALTGHHAVKAAAVVPVGHEADARLAAYVVVTSEVSGTDLRTHLAQRLPEYMIPDHFVRLSELPLTRSGKVDRSALPTPDASNSLDEEAGKEELQTEIQSEVAAILSKLLGGQQIGPHDNFFRVGGHSMLAAQVIARLRSSFKVDVPLRAVFESPTIAGLSGEVETRILQKFDAIQERRPDANSFGSFS